MRRLPALLMLPLACSLHAGCSKSSDRPVVKAKAPAAKSSKAPSLAIRPRELVLGYPSLTIQRNDAARTANLKGLEAHRRNDSAPALELFLKAAELDPSFHMARFNAACALTRLGRQEEALRILEELLQLDLVRYQRLVKNDKDLAALRTGPWGARLQEIVERALKRYRALLSEPGPKFIAFRGRFSDVWHYSVATKRFVRVTDGRRIALQWGLDRQGRYLLAVVAKRYRESREAAICDLDQIEVLKVSLGNLSQVRQELATEPTGPVPQLMQAGDNSVYAFGEPWGYMRIAFHGTGHNDEVEGTPPGVQRMAMALPSPGPTPAPLKVKVRKDRIVVEGLDKPLVPPRKFDETSLALSPDRRYLAMRRAFGVDCDKDDIGVYPEGHVMVADLTSGTVEVIHTGKGRLGYYWVAGAGLVLESGVERAGTSVLLWQPGPGGGTTVVLAAPGSLQEYALREPCGV